MIRRFIGFLVILIGLGGIGLGVMGLRFGHQLVDQTRDSMDETLQLTSSNLDTVMDSLNLAKSTLNEVNIVISTTQTTAVNLSASVSETQPLLDQISTVATEEVPESLESIETALPTLEQVAGVIDETLTTLNNFRIDEEILGLQLRYDLGIDYTPEIPFDQSVRNLGMGIEGLPESMRSLENDIAIAGNNLETISEDIQSLAADLETVNGRLTDIDPILDEYIATITDTSDQIRLVRGRLDGLAENAKNGVTIVMVWLALSQLAPLYLGWELISGRRAS